MLVVGLGVELGVGRQKMSKMHALAVERWVPWNQPFAVSAIIEVHTQPWRRMGDRCTGAEEAGRHKGQEESLEFQVLPMVEGSSHEAGKAGGCDTMKNPPNVLRVLDFTL